MYLGSFDPCRPLFYIYESCKLQFLTLNTTLEIEIDKFFPTRIIITSPRFALRFLVSRYRRNAYSIEKEKKKKSPFYSFAVKGKKKKNIRNIAETRTIHRTRTALKSNPVSGGDRLFDPKRGIRAQFLSTARPADN